MIYRHLTNNELVEKANTLLWGSSLDPIAAELLTRLEDALALIDEFDKMVMRLQEKYTIPDEETAY